MVLLLFNTHTVDLMKRKLNKEQNRKCTYVLEGSSNAKQSEAYRLKQYLKKQLSVKKSALCAGLRRNRCNVLLAGGGTTLASTLNASIAK